MIKFLSIMTRVVVVLVMCMSPNEDVGDEEAKEISSRIFGLLFTCS